MTHRCNYEDPRSIYSGRTPQEILKASDEIGHFKTFLLGFCMGGIMGMIFLLSLLVAAQGG